jgi:uncharacterized membrane protein HdeD (DUF308 family)
MFSAVLAIAVGVELLEWRLFPIVSFILKGVATIMFALDHKRELSRRWGFMLASGMADLALAAIIFYGRELGIAFWAMSLIVGINMLYVALALHARRMPA